MIRPPLILGALALLLSGTLISAEDTPLGGGGGGRNGPRRPDGPIDDVRFLFKTEVPPHPLDIVLGRPTGRSVTASVLAYTDREGIIQYGARSNVPRARTALFELKAGQPAAVKIEGLQPNTHYFYRLSTRPHGGTWEAEPEHSFWTQRPPGSAFTWTVQADPHLDYNTEPAQYLRTLKNALGDAPDFHLDLGDTFMTDKHRGRETAAARVSRATLLLRPDRPERPALPSAGQSRRRSRSWLDGTADNLAVWSNAQRKRYFPNPTPNEFYGGNATPDPQAGLLEDYYAWEWGDALFVVLDPFWFTSRQRGSDDNWARTLGRPQYDWLAATLARSHAKFRFVFLHHLVGGLGRDARGGIEAASLYEWGGHESDGAEVFASKRPGWPMPIHDLLVKNHVNIVFHGHDHLFVRQTLEGIVYQEVPQPGQPRYDNTRSASEYGYHSGTLLGSSGHLRVKVDANKTTVDYVRAYLPADESDSRQNGRSANHYEVLPR